MADSKSPNHLNKEASEHLRLGRRKEAVRAARAAACLTSDPVTRAINLGGILIDVGSDMGDRRLVKEGVYKLEAVRSLVSEEHLSKFHYNLGNGYAAIGEGQRGKGPGTKLALDKAVSHLDQAVELGDNPDAKVNLAGVLLSQGRWIEAQDEFSEILNVHPSHHNALAKRGSSLIGIYNWTSNHSGLLIAALEDHEKAVTLAKGQPIFQRSYRRVVSKLRNKIKPHTPSISIPSPDQEWIWKNRLALNPCPICMLESPGAFDLFPLASRLEGGRRRPPVEDLLELFNSLCRSYSTARWILYKALEAKPTESDHVISLKGYDTAIHSLPVGLLMTSASGFYGVFNQIGFALNSYFHLGHCTRSVTFQSVWSEPRKDRKVPQERGEIHKALRHRATPALTALHRLALSLEFGIGRYSHLRELRNALEHHIVVPVREHLESPYFISESIDEIKRNTFTLGRLAKAAIWYLGGALLYGEQERLKRALKRGDLVVKGRRGNVQRK